ncbi:MAG: KilA-N domain-containing protein [Treponema sp.]|nr:KilA-N domain-containing protein [Treponema sp.]
MKSIKETIHAQGIEIGIYTTDFENEFISLTDIARYKSDEPAAVIQNWMRNRDVIEFLGLWETLHNTDFNHLEFEGFKNAAGANAFTMSPQKWIKTKIRHKTAKHNNEFGFFFSKGFDCYR